jgi:hypothetical protein
LKNNIAIASWGGLLTDRFLEKMPKTMGRFWEGNGKFECYLADVATTGHFSVKF